MSHHVDNPSQLPVQPLVVYWRPGCTSCLRTKEYLTRHGIAFVSVNVIEDEASFQDLVRLGVRRVPIVRRGDDWVDGQVLKDVARIAGVEARTSAILAPVELVARGEILLAAARRFVLQIPNESLDELLPYRPRTYRQLAYHAFEIYQFYLDWAEKGRRLEYADYDNAIVPTSLRQGADLEQYGATLQQRLRRWWDYKGSSENYSRKADVYYGEQTMHEFFERTVWHSGQHARQLQLVVEKLHIAPDGPILPEHIEGLPMPMNVFDDQLQFA